MIATPPVELGTAEAQTRMVWSSLQAGQAGRELPVHRRPGLHPSLHCWLYLTVRRAGFIMSSPHTLPSPSKHSPHTVRVSYVNVQVTSVIFVVGFRQDFPVDFRLELAL